MVLRKYETNYFFVVESTSQDAFGLLENAYGSVKGQVLQYSPQSLGNFLSKVESYASPYVEAGQKGAFNALKCADSTVGRGVGLVSSAATYGREQAGKVVGEDAMKPVDNAAERARGAYSASVDTIKSEGVFGACKAGFSKAYSFAQQVGSSAKTHLADANTNVKEKLEAAQSAAYKNYIVPSVDGAGNLVSKLRTTVTKQPLYANAYNFTTVVYSHLSGWPVVRAPFSFAHAYIYPAVKPVVGPFVDRLGPHVKSVQKSLEPQAEPVPVQEVAMKKVDAAKTQAKKAKVAAEQRASQMNGKAQDFAPASLNGKH